MKKELTEISKEQKKELKTQKKAEKKAIQKERQDPMVKFKKLPSLFRKPYTQKKLEKKIYKRIYIPEDKALLEKFIAEVGKNKKGEALFSIPQTALVRTSENLRLTQLAKDIKASKSRIKWIPLLATIIFVAAIIITLSLTRNIIARKAIVSTCENIFEARTDIGYVNVSFWDSSFTLKKLEIADKNNVMKNLVDIDSIVFDFDLLELTRARFVANELSITGVNSGTDRTVSGELSAAKKAKIAARKKQTEEATSDLMQAIQEKTEAAVDIVKNSVNGVFDQYNPETIIKNCYEQMQSPAVAKNVQTEATALVQKYQAFPEELNQKVQKVQELAKEVSSINLAGMQNDAKKVAEAIKTITQAKEKAEALKAETEKTVKSMKADVNTAAELSKQIQNAITSDTNLIGNEIKKITSLDLDDGKAFIADTFDAVAYQYLGKYYPYVKKGVDYLSQIKNNQQPEEKSEKPAKEEKKGLQRSAGRVVYYKADTTPKFWIKKAAGSGPSFDFSALDLTNNMDKTGKPATANVNFTVNEIGHNAKLSVDTRAASKDALVTANYGCTKLPFAIPSERFGGGPGVPNITSSSQMDFVIKLFENDGFSIGGSGKFTDLNIVPNAFEPEYAYTIYANTMANIKQMNLDLSGGYTLSKGLSLKVNSDADKQVVNALTKEVNRQLNEIKDKATVEMSKKINELTNGALGELNSFDDLKNKISNFNDIAGNLQKQLENKLNEAQAKTQKAAETAMNEAINQSQKKAKDALKSWLTN